jgi:hypothetical protein
MTLTGKTKIFETQRNRGTEEWRRLKIGTSDIGNAENSPLMNTDDTD